MSSNDKIHRIKIGVDFGASKIISGIVVKDKVTSLKRIPTPRNGNKEEIIKKISEAINSSMKDSNISIDSIYSIGIGIPGSIDHERQLCMLLPNVPGDWMGFPLGKKIEQIFNTPTFIMNDVGAITLGEVKYGAGTGCRNIVLVAIGTGIGGGLYLDGKLYLGSDGAAGEIGHIIVDKNGPLCGCGAFGCLEAFSSGNAITSKIFRLIKQGVNTDMTKFIEEDSYNKLNPSIAFKAASCCDYYANWILESTADDLSVVISNLITLLNPDKVIITGGVLKDGEEFINKIKIKTKDRVKMLNRIVIERGKLGDNAGILGAALWGEIMRGDKVKGRQNVIKEFR